MLPPARKSVFEVGVGGGGGITENSAVQTLIEWYLTFQVLIKE